MSINVTPLINSPEMDKYINLYYAVATSGSTPTIEQLKAIVSIVKKDFPENENNY